MGRRYRSPRYRTRHEISIGIFMQKADSSICETFVSSCEIFCSRKWQGCSIVSRSKEKGNISRTGGEEKISKTLGYPTSNNDRPSRSSVTRGFIIVVIVNPDETFYSVAQLPPQTGRLSSSRSFFSLLSHFLFYSPLYSRNRLFLVIKFFMVLCALPRR